MIRISCAAAIALLSACASAPEPAAPSGPPLVELTPGLPAPPQAHLYADCAAQAAATNSLNRERDGETLRFTCTGAPAKAFFDGLGPRSAKVGSEYAADGLTWRFSNKLIKDSYGIDGCSFDGKGNYRCVVILRVGPFIDELDYKLPPS